MLILDVQDGILLVCNPASDLDILTELDIENQRVGLRGLLDTTQQNVPNVCQI